MNAFVWDDGRRLEGLGDPVAEAPILNRALREHQVDALGPPAPARIAALDEIPAGAADYLLVRGHVWLTRRLARRFLVASRASGAATTVLCLEPSVFVRSTIALADVEPDGARTRYAVYYRAVAGPPTAEELARATPVGLAIREHDIPNDLLERRGVRPAGMEVALSAEAILQLGHWSHLVVANYVALFASWFELTPAKAARYLGAVARALPWPNRHRVLRALTVRGRRCRIHPSAVVEASILGDRVEIGPCAVVRGCVLGDDVKIDAHANCNQSSIGQGAVVSFNTQCNLSVLYPQALVSPFGAQMAVLGRRAVVFADTLLMDVRDPSLERDVTVLHGGRAVASGRRVLGPCVGHGAVVGGHVQLAPGLCVPNGAVLLTGSESLVRAGRVTARAAGTP